MDRPISSVQLLLDLAELLGSVEASWYGPTSRRGEQDAEDAAMDFPRAVDHSIKTNVSPDADEGTRLYYPLDLIIACRRATRLLRGIEFEAARRARSYWTMRVVAEAAGITERAAYDRYRPAFIQDDPERG